MSLSTLNRFGKITISDEAVRLVASHTAAECYGVVDLVSKRFSDNVGQLFNKNKLGKGVSVQTVGDAMYVEVFVILKVGVNVDAVKKSLSDAVRFSLETFTGMRVKRVHVNVLGIRV